jgi:uncharacterized membrane protein HdeD (DUF308 family)
LGNWLWWTIAGVISLLGGFFALANPLETTLTAEVLTGWIFVALGIMTMISAFTDQGRGGRNLSILIGLVILLLGINLVGDPLAGIVPLTRSVALLFFVIGVCQILLAFSANFAQPRWIMILAGSVSLLLSGVIITEGVLASLVMGAVSLLLGRVIMPNFPNSTVSVLDICLAVELIWNGIALIALALTRKSNAEVV